MGGGKKGGAKVEVTLYYMSMHQGVCVAADAIRRIIIKEKLAWEGRVTSQQLIAIDKEDLFGGPKKEGGVKGSVMYLPGGENQLLPDHLAQKLGRASGEDCPGFRGLTSLFFYGEDHSASSSGSLGETIWQSSFGGGSSTSGFYWSANVPYLPSIWITVERTPRGLTQTYARIPRLNVDEFPFAVPKVGAYADGRFAFGASSDYFAYWNPSGAIDWYDMDTRAYIGTTAGASFTGSVTSVTLDSTGTAHWMGVSGTGKYLFHAAPGAAVATSTLTDAADIFFSVTRALQTGGETKVLTAYVNAWGYLDGSTNVTSETGGMRDFCLNGDGEIIGLFQEGGSSDSFSLVRLSDGAALGTYSATSRTALTAARICHAEFFGHYFVWMDGNYYLIDDLDFSLKDTITQTFSTLYGTVPDLPAPFPSRTYFWHGWQQFSLEDGSLIRTVDPTDWISIVSETVITYNPWNDEIWSKQAGNNNLVVRELDRGIYDANPSHIIYECLTDTNWGMGSPSTLIDVDSFEEAAVTLFNEGLGLSMIWTRQASIQDFVQEVLDHAQAVLFVDPSTGLLTLKLIRGDYDPDDLPVLDESNADLANFGRKLWGEIVNEIVVTWTNPDNEQDETVTVHDLASITTQGGIVSDGRNYYGVRSAELAQRLAQRDLRAAGAPLATCEAEVDRTQWQLRPASVVKLTWPEYGLSEVVFRVTAIDYGKPGDMGIKLSLIEDVFGLDIGTYEIPPGSIWEDPSSDPDPLDFTQILTLPYFAEVQAGTSVDLAYPDVHAGILGSTDNNDVWEFEVWAEVALTEGGTEWQQLTTNTVTSRALSVADLPAEAVSTAVLFTSATGQTAPSTGTLVLIGEGTGEDMELALITDITEDGYTLQRGVLDTVPRAWPSGTPAWFIDLDEASIADGTTRSDGEEVTYKLRTRTSQGLMPLGASIDPYTLDARPWLPLRPANVTIDGVQFNTIDTPVDMVGETEVPVTWSNRNRLTEDTVILPWTDGDVTPEDGQTTTITVYSADGVTVLDTITGLSGTSYDIPITSFEGASVALVVLTASRTDDDGTFESLQGHGIWVQIEGETGARLTEASDLRVTEAGDARLTEN